MAGEACPRCRSGVDPKDADGLCPSCHNKVEQLKYDDDNDHPQPTKRRGGP